MATRWVGAATIHFESTVPQASQNFRALAELLGFVSEALELGSKLIVLRG
jgi:uncharacterized protein YukE